MYSRKLPREFYLRSCSTVARDLIGKVLVRNKDGKIYSGIIVETEAYPGKGDEASHSFRGITPRNSVMFEEGGVAYVYFTYGNHYCFNVVTGRKGCGSAVLIRAVEPLDGINLMMQNRRTDNIANLTNGPGKLTQAFEIDMEVNGKSLSGRELYICNSVGKAIKVRRSPRIGISKNKDALLRFYADNNPYVSVKRVKVR